MRRHFLVNILASKLLNVLHRVVSCDGLMVYVSVAVMSLLQTSLILRRTSGPQGNVFQYLIPVAEFFCSSYRVFSAICFCLV